MGLDDGCNEVEMLIRKAAFEECAKILESKTIEADCCQGDRKGKFCDSYGCETLLELAREFRKKGG